jgi:hypothetical protein
LFTEPDVLKSTLRLGLKAAIPSVREKVEESWAENAS